MLVKTSIRVGDDDSGSSENQRPAQGGGNSP
jgi:hypothetical protein